MIWIMHYKEFLSSYFREKFTPMTIVQFCKLPNAKPIGLFYTIMGNIAQ